MKTQTTAQTITRAQIRALSTESAEAGDLEMVAICDRALIIGERDETAIAECARVINAAEAMVDDDTEAAR